MTTQSDYESWLADLSLDRVRSILVSLRCETVLVKHLQRNNNSKNQIYLAPTVNHLVSLPMGTPIPRQGTSTKNGGSNSPLFTIPVHFSWISPSGIVPAPDAKLCDYSQYPEVRFSGFLKGCADPPSYLLVKEKRGTEEGRVLLIGISRTDGQCYGLVVPVTVPLNAELRSLPTERQGILQVWSLTIQDAAIDARELLLRSLCSVARRGWIDGQRLTNDGLVPYRARNGGGYTLEAELGIVSNALSGPDFHGWELKQRDVHSLQRPRVKSVTLFDIAPDGGEYHDVGVIDFTERRGRAHSDGRRRDFTGKHRAGAVVEATGLTLTVDGLAGDLIDPNGSIALLDNDQSIAMSWSFLKLFEHWNRKHALAAFVRSENRDVAAGEGSKRQYRFGGTIELGVGTDFRRFLLGIAEGRIAFDPGLKIERSGDSDRWRSHARFPFRINSADLPLLYHQYEFAEACG